MDKARMQVLLIEDNPGDAELVKARLVDKPFDVAHETHLEDGVARASHDRPDAVLLDLNLPDSDGLSTVERFLESAPDLPVVVLTVLNNEEMGVSAVDIGAQDYLVKEDVTPQSLVRALRYAVLRHSARAAEARRASSLENEVRRLRALLGPREIGAVEPLTSRSPHAFDQIVDAFRERIVGSQDDQRAGVVMARMMADLGAGPRDVMDVYARASADVVRPGASLEEREDLASRARIAALELMGRLVELYSMTGPRGRGLVGQER